MASTINTTFVVDTLGAVIGAQETALYSQINTLPATPTQTELILLQKSVDDYSLTVSLSTSILSALSDVLKGIVQKI